MVQCWGKPAVEGLGKGRRGRGDEAGVRAKVQGQGGSTTAASLPFIPTPFPTKPNREGGASARVSIATLSPTEGRKEGRKEGSDLTRSQNHSSQRPRSRIVETRDGSVCREAPESNLDAGRSVEQGRIPVRKLGEPFGAVVRALGALLLPPFPAPTATT